MYSTKNVKDKQVRKRQILRKNEKKKKQPTSLLNIVIGMIRTIFTKVYEAMCSWSEASRWPLGAR